MGRALISICIPAYKRVNYLRRLLDSIADQTFRDFEVVISDDSGDHSVENLLASYTAKFPVRYYKNDTAKGTPANWNAAIAAASGEWIKLMHDDDWFASPESLARFAGKTKEAKKIICSGYTSQFENNPQQNQLHLLSSAQHRRIERNPCLLLLQNLIGPPSTMMVHHTISGRYDERMKWRVDCDYYVTVLSGERSFAYINTPLINIGMSDSQVTNTCINNAAVEIPEGFILLQKHGASQLRTIRIYDAWWRLFRNMRITTREQLHQYGDQPWPEIIYKMVNDLKKAPEGIYRSGIVSKMCMLFSYLRNRNSATST